MNIIVTGGAGFIGSHVVDKYIEEGHKVIVIDNLSTGKREFVNKDAEFYQMDICDSALEEIFKSNRIDILNHHAAQIDVRKSIADPLFDAQVNIIGSLKLLGYCVKYRVKKIIYASTGGAIYGEPEEIPVDEKHPIKPLSAYGVSKHAVEHYIQLFNSLYGLDYTIFRYSNIYGPRQDPSGEAGVIAIFSGKFLKNESPIIFGSGEQTRDFLYVSDVAEANLKSLELGSCEILNLGTGKETSVNSLFRKMKGIVNSEVSPEYHPQRKGEVFRIALNNKKAKEKLNWSPKVSFHEGLYETIKFFKS